MISFHLEHQLGDTKIDLCVNSSAPVLALFGQSGAGKSSILKMIAGLITPESGTIIINGQTIFDSSKSINFPAAKRAIGYVPQNALLFPHLSVEKNITFSHWAGKRQSTIDLEKLLQLLGINELASRSTKDLSGGERQRVALARALYSSPQLLLLDEPLSALDEQLKSEALSLIETVIGQFNIPTVYVSHSVSEVAHIADEIVVLEKGQVKFFGPTLEVMGSGEETSGLAAQVLLEGKVIDQGDGEKLGRIKTKSMELLMASKLPKLNSTVKIKIDPRDVMLATGELSAISAQNRFKGKVIKIEPLKTNASAMVMVHVAIGDEILMAKITLQAARQLNLEIDAPVQAIIKTAALLEHF